MGTVQPLNYCRQILEAMRHGDTFGRAMASRWQEALAVGQKFILPPGALSLPEGTPNTAVNAAAYPLRLPYPVLVLEFRGVNGSKNCVVAAETGPYIEMFAVLQLAGDHVWRWADGTYRVSVTEPGMYLFVPADLTEGSTPCAGDDVCRDVLRCFLAALACSNVSTERIPARKPAKRAANALPFDDYHVLVVNTQHTGKRGSGTTGDHRSPREHLRRGHIVIPEGRQPYWRQGCLVNAGKAGGRVFKDYAIQQGAPL